MPIIIEGYVTVSVRDLKTHTDHDLKTWSEPDGRQVLWCATDQTAIEREPEPSTSLDCGCPDLEEHGSGVALQVKFRKEYRIPRSTCVGCYLGDDGISIHSCVIHDERYWPRPQA